MAIAAEHVNDPIPVWVCLGCRRVFTEPRPTRGKGGQSATDRHKVYPATSPASRGTSAKLGAWYWCGPIVEWVAVPAARLEVSAL